MDFWVLGSKSALLFYVVLATSFLGPPNTLWVIFAYLIYLCLNVSIPIFKQPGLKRIVAAAACLFAGFCAYSLDPKFALLLPAGVFELGLLLAYAPRIALLLGAAPLLAVPHDLLPLYILCALFCYLLFGGLRTHADKLGRSERDREALKEDIERLTRTLNENKDYIRQSEYTIKLEERNRLSQSIHDEIGHSMAGALIQMEASRRLLDADKAKSSELLGNAIAISKEGLERIRLTLKDMKPKSEELGIHRLRLFADELSAKRGIAAAVTYEGDMDAITPIHWKIIQDNATEAVTNSLKYGGATSVDIEVRVLNRMIRSVVADNGRGANKIVKGLGIAGMEERAASVGGTVVVDGSNGFRVTTLLPYR